jgi:hypothetical protein
MRFDLRESTHLRIKAFYGTTENAVKTQIWVAVHIDRNLSSLNSRLSARRYRPDAYQLPVVRARL